MPTLKYRGLHSQITRRAALRRLQPGQKLTIPRRGEDTLAVRPLELRPPERVPTTEGDPPERRVEQEPVVEPERPVEQAPREPDRPVETEPAGGGEATVEMGLLADGIQQGTLTREEFQALNSAANQYTERRSRYGADGYSPEELRGLGTVERQYGQMYTRFIEHDRSRIRFEGADSEDPAAAFRAAQNQEAGRLYDQFRVGEIDTEALITALMAQRERARDFGTR